MKNLIFFIFLLIPTIFLIFFLKNKKDEISFLKIKKITYTYIFVNLICFVLFLIFKNLNYYKFFIIIYFYTEIYNIYKYENFNEFKKNNKFDYNVNYVHEFAVIFGYIIIIFSTIEFPFFVYKLYKIFLIKINEITINDLKKREFEIFILIMLGPVYFFFLFFVYIYWKIVYTLVYSKKFEKLRNDWLFITILEYALICSFFFSFVMLFH